MFEDAAIAAPVQEVAAGLFVVRLPMPVRLDPVNCWVGISATGLATIVDAGLAPGAAAAWRAALRTIGIDPEREVERVVVTHFHPDHIGGTGALQRLTGAPVLGSRATVEQSPGVWGAGAARYAERMSEHLRVHGMPAARIAELAPDTALARAAVELPDRLEPLSEADVLDFAGATWTVVPTPGHADGHVVLHDAAGGRMLAGDHLLERISPAVGRFPGHAADPLGNYVASLDRVADLGVDLVLPGHGEPFAGATARARALLQHHETRVDACLAAIGSAGATAWEVAREVFGDQHDAANERFAVTESLAHLEHARFAGRVERTGDDEAGWRYVAPAC